MHAELRDRGGDSGGEGCAGSCAPRVWRGAAEALADDDGPRPDAEAAKRPHPPRLRARRRADRRYVGDITYIATWEGLAYLATVIDLASRRVVGWAIADHMRTDLVEEALGWRSSNAGRRRA